MIFDTHSHLHFKDFTDIENEIKIMREYGVKYATLVGSDCDTSADAIELAKKYPHFFATVGIHPTDVGENIDIFTEIEKLDKLVEKERENIVAIGEIGFDYFHLNEDKIEEEKEKQKELFFGQVEIAKKYNLPVIIHTRNAKDDTLKYIKESGIKKFVIHCFTENYEFTQDIMDYSPEAYFGFSGIVTFKKASDIQDAASKIPLSKILVETDAPYLTPEPFRGQKINTSGYTKFVLEKIKELRGESREEIENQIFENSLNFYGIPALSSGA
ncbi:TatD family hydrolase [Candidatus Gracilibacteria bacterium]|nr:TatD family hydrolase [Candidatus Gracilibacteria bacterium]